jgi:exonuclease VII small subunit
MKKKTIILAVLLIAIAGTAYKMADDILSKLRIERTTAQRYIVSNFVGRFSSEPMGGSVEDRPGNSVENQLESFNIPTVSLSNVISNDKAAAATELCEYVKKYINSEEFITDYNLMKKDAMPLTQNGSSLSTLEKDKVVLQKNINNYKTDTKYVAEQQKMLDETQKKIDAIMEAAKKPFPLKENWEKMFPVDPSIVIKNRLQEYLQLVATVDFTAKLTEPDNYKIKKFVNPAYEKKSLKWKAIFRAGKEVNDAVTAFVKDWLKGEIIAKQKNRMTENASTDPSINQNKNTQVNSAVRPPNTNQKNTVTINTPSTNSTDSSTIPVKEKKSLFNKIKDKTKGIIKN